MIPRWVDRDQFPFVVHTFDTFEGRLAYVDEGKGKPIVFVHGNPSWSFLYRHLISALSKDHRCIAIDHLGFGLSDKAAKADYTPRAHVQRLGDFIDHLGLEDVTLVAHDFGGPIALSWAMQRSSRVSSIVLFNTWMWSLRKNPEAIALYRIFDNPLNRFYYSNLKASPKFFLPILVADAHEMPKRELEQFLFPFDEHKSRQGAYMMARHLIKSSDWLDGLWAQKAKLQEIPMLLLWGENDKLSGEEGLSRLTDAFPLARPVKLENVGNFVPQDASRRALIEIRGFLRSLRVT